MADGVIYPSSATLRLARRVVGPEAPGVRSDDGFGDAGIPDLERATATAALEALDAFVPGLVVPLNFGITVACLDEGGDGVHDRSRLPATWHRYLESTGLPPEVAPHPFYVDAEAIPVGEVDARSRRELVAGIFGQSCEHVPASSLSWTEMYVTAAWVRLSDGDRDPSDGPLVIDDLDGHRLDLEVPVSWRDGAPGVVGPLGWLGSVPVELWVFADPPLTLQVIVRWSLWWEAEAPGRQLLDAVVERLEDLGWRAS